jgi:NAD/NADP transhydrogenase beta subunit
MVAIKRTPSPGFGAIPDPLLAADNALMLLSDGRKELLELTAAAKES